jgi:putative endonuclease
MNIWYVYILRCSDNTLYTGIAKDIEKRIEMHNSGKGAKYTRGRGPVKLVWSEVADSESVAKKREAEIKKMSRGEKEELL